MGSVNVPDGNPLKVLEQALRGGVTCFQLREKGEHALQGNEKLAFAKSCQQLCIGFDVPFIVNDDVELAIHLGADGVHVGQDDLDTREVRKRIGDLMVLGVSVHSLEEAAAALEVKADYVGMGPVYRTESKADAKPVAGITGIASVASRFPDLPIVGIGGITSTNLEPVLKNGASGVSVISAIAGAKNPEVAARSFAKTVQLIKVSV